MDNKKNITNDKKIKSIQKVLGKDFVLKYKKRIFSVSIFSNIVCYDLIFINKSYSR